MPQQSPGTTPVTDQRPPVRGVIPRHLQTWLMAGVALVIFLIIFITGRPQPEPRAADPRPTAATAPDARRVRDLEERLRQLNARAQQQEELPADPFVDIPREPRDTAPAIDPFEQDRKRREYESLYARVLSTQGQRGETPTANTSPAAPTPSLDAVVEAVMRAGGQAVPPGTPTGPAQALPAPTSTPAPTTLTHRLPRGTIIPTVLVTRLDGSGDAPVTCLVTSPVYAADRQRVLIPAGARVLGTAKAVQRLGDSRLAVGFDRLVMPTQQSYALTNSIGLNQRGDAQLHDQVDSHDWSMFGAAAAVGLLAGLSQTLSATAGINDGAESTVIVNSGADATATAMSRTLDRFLNRPPTITIREGHRVHVYLMTDLDLPPYDPHGTVTPPHQPASPGVR